MKHFRAAACLCLAVPVAVAACKSATAPRFPTLVITTEELPAATRGEPYAEAVRAEGGDGAFTWDVVQGALPDGLVLMVDDLASDRAIITGTPDDEGTAVFTIRVRSDDGQTATRQLELVVLPGSDPLVIQTRRLAPGLVGGPYAVTLRANGGDGETFEWELVSGALPPGLGLTATGRIEGTPTATDTTAFTVEVRSGGLAAQADIQMRVVAPDPNRYRVTTFAVVDFPSGILPHLDQAVAEWEAAIVGNLPGGTIPEDFFGPNHCAGFGPLLNGTSLDDILVMINIISIDGPGGVLGRAGPCAVRLDGSLPIAGIITLDADDLTPLIGTETLTDIIAHELAHVLGFGALWEHFELIDGAGTNDPRFTGPGAVAEYHALGGAGAVPVETEGGEGTAEGHWRKSVFGIELMTGFVEPVGVDQPLSRVSIASMADLGYLVDLDAADSFTLARVLLGPMAADGRHMHGTLGYDEIYDGPVLILPDDAAPATFPRR